MLGAREDADESAERRLEASLRPKRLAARYGWRLPDDQLQFRDEGSDELAVGAESFFDGATPICSNVALDGSSQATCSTSALTAAGSTDMAPT